MVPVPEEAQSPPTVDLHIHAPDFVPQPFRALWHAVTPGRPRSQGFDSLRNAGVDIALAKAVGDPVVTRWYLGRPAAGAVEAQLKAIERAAVAAGGEVVTDLARLGSPMQGGHGGPRVILGVEGGDFLGEDLDSVGRWFDRGVRSLVLVHLRDNQLGRTCLPWQKYAGPVPVRRRSGTGLSRFGSEVVARMNDVGMLVDLAHADRATVLDAVAAARAPVVSTHTGARALQDFPRFLADDELRAIASTGGVVGLWPYRFHRRGARDITEIVAHGRYIAALIGAEHLALGTDMNGVPGQTLGFREEADLEVLRAALLRAGFTGPEVAAVFGGNALRVLHAVHVAAGARNGT